MRVQLAITLAVLAVATPAAAAQNSSETASNQAAATSSQKPDPDKQKKKATKPAGDKICKRLSQGKVCMTAEQWKEYEEPF